METEVHPDGINLKNTASEMKKFFYMAVAAIAALSSCSSDNDIIKEETVKQPLKFTATMEGSATRATLSDNKAQWEVNDQININGKAYKATTAGASTTLEAETTGDEAELVDGKYKAYFPASMYVGTTVTLPASYTYEEGDGNFDMPMYAESSTTVLSFKNLCGVLAITVPQSEMTSVKSIEVSSDKQMNGKINISSISDEVELTFASSSPTDAEKKVTLTAASAISTLGKTFYVPVPAGTHNPLLITISNGTETKAMITKKSGGVTVARSNIYSINFKENTNAWENQLTLGKDVATKIEIETDVTTIPTSGHQKLNDSGIVWAVLEGTTLKIQTSSPKIIGNGPINEVGLFEGYSKVESITGLENIDFSEVTEMIWMFYGCSKLKSLDLSSFNTSKVTNMKNMFFGCNALESIILSSFNTSKVTNMYGMFYNCNALQSLNLSNFNTSEVTDMSYMFNNCSALTSLDLSGSFNTSKVTTMLQMFWGCNVLQSLDLTNFNTSEVTNMNNMFRECKNLRTLKLSSDFVMTKVASKTGMFFQCGWDWECKVYGATGNEDTYGTVKYAFTHGDTNWSNYMMFAD